MKKLLYITLVFAFIGGIQNQSQAWIGEGTTETWIEEGPQKDKNGANYVFVRVDNYNSQLWVVFYGPAHKAGDNVDMKIFSSNGELVQQDFLYGQGGSKKEAISVDGLEPGNYTVEITGDIYNLTQEFTLD